MLELRNAAGPDGRSRRLTSWVLSNDRRFEFGCASPPRMASRRLAPIGQSEPDAFSAARASLLYEGCGARLARRSPTSCRARFGETRSQEREPGEQARQLSSSTAQRIKPSSPLLMIAGRELRLMAASSRTPSDLRRNGWRNRRRCCGPPCRSRRVRSPRSAPSSPYRRWRVRSFPCRQPR
jgi:hypothetical protein